MNQANWSYFVQKDLSEHFGVSYGEFESMLPALFDDRDPDQAIVYQALTENMASEQSARMVAMKSASDNAGSVIDELTLIYNKARQAAITKELSEIVGGAAAV